MWFYFLLCVSYVSTAVGTGCSFAAAIEQSAAFLSGCMHIQAWNLKQSESCRSVWNHTQREKFCSSKTHEHFLPSCGTDKHIKQSFLPCNSRGWSPPVFIKASFFSLFIVEEGEESFMAISVTGQQKFKIDVKIWFTNSLTISGLVVIVQSTHPALCVFQDLSIACLICDSAPLNRKTRVLDVYSFHNWLLTDTVIMKRVAITHWNHFFVI